MKEEEALKDSKEHHEKLTVDTAIALSHTLDKLPMSVAFDALRRTQLHAMKRSIAALAGTSPREAKEFLKAVEEEDAQNMARFKELVSHYTVERKK